MGLCWLAWAAAIALLASVPAAAQTQGDLYKGKTVRLVVGTGVGGGYDIYARLFAPHLAKRLPGQPNVIVQNMEGAASITATNWAYRIAPKDGSVILATANALLFDPLFGNTAADFETTNFEWIGSIGKQQQVCVAWHSSKIKTIADVQAQEMTVSATGTSGGPAIWPRIANAMIGTRFKVIGGYSTGASRLAVERGEVDGICGLAWSTLKTADPRWIQDKLITVLMQMGTVRQAELPDVPLLYDMVRSEEDRATLRLIFVPDEMGRPYLMPPGTSAPHVAAVREAFRAVMTDPVFKAEAASRGLEIDPIQGEDMARTLADAVGAPRAVVERAAALLWRAPQKK